MPNKSLIKKRIIGKIQGGCRPKWNVRLVIIDYLEEVTKSPPTIFFFQVMYLAPLWIS